MPTRKQAGRQKRQACDDGEGDRRAPNRAKVQLPSAHGPFISLAVSPEKLARFGQSSTQAKEEVLRVSNEQQVKKSHIVALKLRHQPAALVVVGPSIHPASNEANHDPQQPPEMNTRGAWSINRANSNRLLPEDAEQHVWPLKTQTSPTPSRKRKQATHHDSADDILRPQSVKRQRTTRKSHTPAPSSPLPDATLNESDGDTANIPSSSSPTSHSDKENESGNMERPKLALKLSFANKQTDPKQNDGFIKPPTPAASSPPAQTPTIKLKVKNQDGSAKKRKRTKDERGDAVVPTPTSALPKIKLKTSVQPPGQSPVTPGVKLHTKGKIPKRPLGVGYDSELSETERDPVILEGFVLRMQPGKDCDYLKEHITKGTMGHNKMQGGADVGINVFDDKGRRCCLRVRQNKYAATLVDLPTVSEGMKSWDGKRFIKSMDICQMMIVLGLVKTEEEAKAYPLPAGINPKSYQYAHGLTAPMHWVRKRRFERTKRTRVDEIESIDRKVGQLLTNDASSLDVVFESFNYDPRLDEDQYSGTDSEDDDNDDDDEDDDAEGEEEDYFNQGGPEDEDQAHEPDEAEVNAFDEMFAEDDDEVMADSTEATETGQVINGAVDSSGFATSNADSPDVTGSLAPTTAPTPAGDVSTPAAATPGTDGDNDSEEEDDGDDQEAKNEKDEESAQARERLATLLDKRRETKRQVEATANHILKRRLALKYQDYTRDINMQRRILGEPIPEGEE